MHKLSLQQIKVDAKDEFVKNYYARYGFVSLEDNIKDDNLQLNSVGLTLTMSDIYEDVFGF